MTYLLIVLYLFLGFFVYKKYYKVYGFIHPMVWMYIWGFFNFPFRAFSLLFNMHSNCFPLLTITDGGVSYALLYVLFIMLERFFIYYPKQSFKFDLGHSYDYSEQLYVLYKIFIIIILLYKVYCIVNGELYSLGEENFDNNNSSLFQKLFGEINRFDYFFILLGLYFSVYLKKHKRFVYFTLCIYLIFSVFITFVSTSKGEFIRLITIFFMASSLFKFRIKKSLIIIIAIFFYFFVGYSYSTRYYGVTTGKFRMSDLFDNFSSFGNSNSPYLNSNYSFAFFDRLYFLDPIIYINQNTIDKSNYPYGSLKDLLGVIPRSIWSSKPEYLDFGLFTTKTFWKIDSMSENPIGHIAESYYLWGYFGIIFFPFLIFAFKLIFDIMFIKGSLISKFMFLVFFVRTICGDGSWLTYNYRFVIEGLIFIFFFNLYIKSTSYSFKSLNS